MKFYLPELTSSQKDKLADFAINFAVAWFVAAIISPFFTLPNLTLFNGFRILIGVGSGIVLLLFSLSIVKEETHVSPKRRSCL